MDRFSVKEAIKVLCDDIAPSKDPILGSCLACQSTANSLAFSLACDWRSRSV